MAAPGDASFPTEHVVARMAPKTIVDDAKRIAAPGALVIELARGPSLEIVAEDVHVRVDKCGRLMTAGTAPRGWYMSRYPMCRLGHAPPFRSIPTLEPVPKLRHERIIGVATDCENSAIFAISRSRLWSWGTQQNGTLGNGTRVPVCYEPRVILDLDHPHHQPPKAGTKEEPLKIQDLDHPHHQTTQVGPKEEPLKQKGPTRKGRVEGRGGGRWVQVSGGMRHGAALTSNGRLYTWGLPHWGSGHADVSEQLTPAVPEALADKFIVYVRCLPNYGNGTLAVDRDGNVWRPNHDPVTRTCPWQSVPISTLLASLRIPLSADVQN